MLTPEQNDLVRRSAPSTPLGQLFRRYWLPVAALHQHYVLFRDEQERQQAVRAQALV